MSKSETQSTTVWAFLRAVGHHWTTLMSGGVITVLLGVFERLSGKSVPLWVYVAILIFFALLACYLAWRDSQKERTTVPDAGRQRRKMIAERLEQLIKESPLVTPPWIAIQHGT